MFDTLVQYVAGVVIALTAMALAHFGMDIRPARSAPREVHRLADCGHGEPGRHALIHAEHRDC